jgi:hypothetical protein
MKLLDFINQSLEKNLVMIVMGENPLRCGSTSVSERQTRLVFYSVL